MNNYRQHPRSNRRNDRNGRNGRHGRNKHSNGRFNPSRRHFDAPVQRNEAEESFLRKTVIDPAPRIPLEAGLQELTVRAMDLLCPIGRGQRGLIVAPPGSGKTTFLKHICQAVHKADPDVKLYCLLIDERPEEVTDFKRSVPADVRYSSCDQPYENHVKVANELMKEVYEQVNEGKHVMILLDSLTRLSRVHNSELKGNGKTLSGGMDARGLIVPRRIFGSARNVENGGSLSIIATILVQTGSRMDDVIFEEFKGTGNMEIVLSREISSRRIFPAVDIKASATRKEERLIDPKEIKAIHRLRNVLSDMNPVDAAKTLTNLLGQYATNKELLAFIDQNSRAA